MTVPFFICTECTPIIVNKDVVLRQNASQRLLSRTRTYEAKQAFRKSSDAYRKHNAMLYKSYVLRVQANLRRSPRSFWSFVNAKRKCRDIPTNVYLNESEAHTSSTTCELFARHFASVFAPTAASTSEAQYAAENVPANAVDMGTFHISREMVHDAAKKLKCSFAPGPDGIPSVVYCRCIEALTIPLCLMFNRSFSQRQFPGTWKTSFIVPVFKSGDKRDVKNYRGITNLSAGSKLFEIIVSKVFLNQIKSYISPDQHGFMPSRSVTTNLLEFTSTCITHLENKTQVDVVYTDLKDAFDRIDHEILICKLQRLGVSDDKTCWLGSYLVGRTLRVRIASDSSEPFIGTSGVPQGSNLGPLLFNLYFNDIILTLDSGCKLGYADDLKIFKDVRSANDCAHLQTLLDIFVQWCERNRLTISISKCVVMTYHRSQCPILFDYKVNDIALHRVNQVSDLGVILDPKLSFDLHRSSIVTKANRQLGFISKLSRDFTEPYCLKSLYCALVRPILENAAVVWSPYQVSWTLRIERVQKRFIRLALRNLPWNDPENLPPYADRCRLLDLDTLERQRNIQKATFVAKLVTAELDAPWLLSSLNFRAQQRQTRSTTLLQHAVHRTSYGYHEPITSMIRVFTAAEDLFEFGEPVNRFTARIKRSSLF